MTGATLSSRINRNNRHSRSFRCDSTAMLSTCRLAEHRERRSSAKFKCWADNVPNEVWVDVLKFLSREQLEKCSLICAKFDTLVYTYFPTYPLRQVRFCKFTSNKSGMMRLNISCSNVRNFESNCATGLWLRNCTVDCIRFFDFKFTSGFITELSSIDTLSVNYLVFNYERKINDMRTVSIKEEHLRRLFALPAFKNCKGAIFCFNKPTIAYRPSFHFLLTLPLTTLVIDFRTYHCTPNDLRDVANWLNGEPVLSSHPDNDEHVTQCENPSSPSSSSFKTMQTRTLSVKNMVYDDGAISRLVEELKKAFLADTDVRRPFCFNADDDTVIEWNLELENRSTGEKFTVKASLTENLCIQRFIYKK